MIDAGIRRLAAAVLMQAIRDLTSRNRGRAGNVLNFLTGADPDTVLLREFWLRAADIQPSSRQRLQRITPEMIARIPAARRKMFGEALAAELSR